MRTTTKKATTTDQKIDSLKPGRAIELSRNNQGTRVIAERTSDGKRVRIVREFTTGERILGFEIVLDQVW